MGRNKPRDERMYPQCYPTKYRYLDVEKWQICYSLEGEFTSQIDMIMAFDANSAIIKSKDNMVYGVYCWGINEKCRLGKQLGTTNTYTPFKIDSLSEERIIDIACNSYNCLALTDSGKVYIWGSIDFRNHIVHQPRQVGELKMKKIVQIACGRSFIVALSDDGKLYIWGRNENGQLGINTARKICLIPCLITSLENVKIVKIVCGSEHSLALTSKGKIYSWGNNCKGQLGHGERFKLRRAPTMLIGTAMGTISDIAAQNDTSVAINKLESVYVWGFLSSHIWKPIRIECSNMHNVFRYKIPHIIHDSTREQSNTLEYLKTIFDDQSTSDFTIKVERKHIHVHKTILIRCDYFKNMLHHGWREARENTIKCNDFPYNVYKSFFKCLYTDAVDNLPLEETLELLKLCDKYTEKDVAEKCVEVIKENLNVSNVALCFAIATECNAEDLVESCVQFSLGQMSDIIKSEAFVALSKELLLDFLMKTSDAGAYIHA
ncbi:RCC1 and BTB domain-containing protein 1 [Camponotus japonicus]